MLKQIKFILKFLVKKLSLASCKTEENAFIYQLYSLYNSFVDMDSCMSFVLIAILPLRLLLHPAIFLLMQTVKKSHSSIKILADNLQIGKFVIYRNFFGN